MVVTGVSVGGGGEQGHSTESAKNPAGGRRAGLERALQALQPSHPRTGPDEPALADRHGAPFGWVQPPVMFAEPWAGTGQVPTMPATYGVRSSLYLINLLYFVAGKLRLPHF